MSTNQGLVIQLDVLQMYKFTFWDLSAILINKIQIKSQKNVLKSEKLIQEFVNLKNSLQKIADMLMLNLMEKFKKVSNNAFCRVHQFYGQGIFFVKACLCN